MSILMCARCKDKPRASQMTGCLCDDCEAAIDGMSQAELDADWATHQSRSDLADAVYQKAIEPIDDPRDRAMVMTAINRAWPLLAGRPAHPGRTAEEH